MSIATETYYKCNVTAKVGNNTITLENAGCKYEGHGSLWSCVDPETGKLKISD